MKEADNFNIDSIILEQSNRKEEFLKLILEWTGHKKLKLLYRGTKDGINSKKLHDKCDNQGKTITLYRNDKGNIFGGYASIPWSSEGGTWKSAPDSFIFTLTNIYNYKPTKLPAKKQGMNYKEVYHNESYGPTFGNDLGLYSNNKGWALKFETYEGLLGKTNSLFTGEENEGKDSLTVNEVEVFKLI